MARNRSEFITKYEYLYDALGLNKRKVLNILKKYDDKVLDEIGDSEVLEKVKKIKFHMDVRTPEEYIYDLNDGWLLEDLIFEWLKNRKDIKSIELIGHDSDRKIKDKKITATPDFRITDVNNDVYELELKTSSKVHDEITIKEGNFKEHHIMYYFIKENRYMLLDPKEVSRLYHIPLKPNPKWNNKMCYTISKMNIYKIGLNFMVEK